MTGLKRNLEERVDQLLKYFPIVLILGVRQCGKTTLAQRVRPQWRYWDLEKGSHFEQISRDIDFFFKENPEHLIIDEAQRFPRLFQELRGIIDEQRSQKNRFLLTGSSSPDLIRNASETLAGRIGIIELGTLKMNEAYQRPLSPFYSIFSQPLSPKTIDDLKSLKTGLSHEQVMNHFLRGGYPEPLLADDPKFYDLWMENYFNTYIQRDIRSLFPRLDLIRYQRFISMLSNLTGTIINKSEVGRSLDVSEVTIRDYLEIAHGTYLWRNIPSYTKAKSRSVVKMPKGTFRDSGLAHTLQGIRKREDLLVNPRVGKSFESFMVEEIIKGLQALEATGWKAWHFRTRNGAEVDLVLEGPFGVLPIEIKFGLQTRLKQLLALQAFVKKQKLPFGIIVNNSDEVRLLSPEIIQLPASLL